MEFLIKGLNSYNSFLKRHVKLEINEIKKIYSKITTLPTKEKIETVNKIIQSFESERYIGTCKILVFAQGFYDGIISCRRTIRAKVKITSDICGWNNSSNFDSYPKCNQF
jgi:hypothetical protein